MAIKSGYNYLLYAALAALTILLLYNLFIKRQIALPVPAEKLIVDTVYIPQKVVKIVKAKPSIIRRNDTVFTAPAFTAILDTIYKKDTVRIEYSFPENLISMELKTATDTMYKERIIFAPTLESNSKWYEPYLYALGGIAAGYIASEIINRR